MMFLLNLSLFLVGVGLICYGAENNNYSFFFIPLGCILLVAGTLMLVVKNITTNTEDIQRFETALVSCAKNEDECLNHMAKTRNDEHRRILATVYNANKGKN